MDVSRITEYYEGKPYRRTVFVLDRLNGQEYTFDPDNDGQTELCSLYLVGSHCRRQ